MTNAAASIALTFDGVDVQDADFGIFLEIIEGFNEAPETRGKDVIVPSLEGQVFRNRKADRRRILLSGLVRGNGATDDDRKADYRSNVLALQALFDPTADPAPLVATDEAGNEWTIDARTVSNGLQFTSVIQSLIDRVTVTLDSVTPNWSAAGS